MSEQTPQEPRDFDQLENDTAKWQEEEYMKSLMGRGLNENDASSEKRREEAKAYDAHLRGLKDRDNDPTFKIDLKDEDVFKDTVTEINPIQKKIDLLSQQIMEIETSYKEKGSTDADRLSTVVEKDLESKKALRDKLLAELRQENDGLLEKSPAVDPVIDQENVNQLIDELNEYDENKNGDSDDHENDSDDTITPLVPVDPIPPTDPGEVIGDGETPGTDIVLREPMPQDPAERSGWFKRNRNKLLAGAVAFAIGMGAGWGLFGGDKDNKDNQRSGTDEKTEQKQNAQSSAEHDKFMSQFKVNESDDHEKNKTVSSGFEQGDSAKEASEQLKKNLGHHPVLLAEVVYAYQNGIGVDEARQHVDEINKMAKSFVNGDYLNADGRKWAEKLGSSIDKGSARWVTEEEMNHATWYNSGIEEKGNFDKFFINDNAGFSSEKILRVRLANGKIVYFKEDCVNMLLKDKIETESTNTFDGGSTFTDTDRTNSEIEDDPKDPDTGKKKKGKVYVDDHGTADTGGVRSEGPGNPEAQQPAGGQTDTQAEQQAGAGTGTADGATEAERPAGSSNGASGQTSNGTVGE